MPFYVYIIKTSNERFYTGITNNLKRRFNDHASGRGSKFCRDNGVVGFIYSEEVDTLELATKREKQIKGWSKEKKKALISGDKEKLKILSKSKP